MSTEPTDAQPVALVAEVVAKALRLQDRATVAAAYRLNCSPHEWTEVDSLAMAQFVVPASIALEALAEQVRVLREALEDVRDGVRLIAERGFMGFSVQPLMEIDRAIKAVLAETAPNGDPK